MLDQKSDELPEKERKTLLEKILSPEHESFLSKRELIRKDHCALKAMNPCQKCDGQGYIPVSRGVYAGADLCSCVVNCRICLGNSLDVSSGDAVSCRRPSPFKRASLFNKSCVPARYARTKFELFSNQSGNCMEIVQKVKSWAYRFQPFGEMDQKGFILAGPVGCGKTYLLTTAVKALAHRGISAKFVDFYQLIAEIKASYSSRKGISDGLLESLLEVDVLAIDELGKGRRSDFEQTILDQLVMGRYNQEKAIIASTNCSLAPSDQKEEEYIGETQNFLKNPALNIAVGSRIYSRLSETTAFWTMNDQCEDYRIHGGR